MIEEMSRDDSRTDISYEKKITKKNVEKHNH